MQNQDYKLKYKDLKLKFMDAVDVAFRLGIEQGLQQAQIQQLQQQQAQQEQMAQQQGQPGQEQEDHSQEQGPQDDQDGSELDSHINELESMLHKTETSSPEYAVLSKSITGMKSMQAKMKKKHADKMIHSIGRAMKKPFIIGEKAQRNMSEPAKKSLNMQEELVKNIIDGWQKEEQDVFAKVTKTLGVEGILKG